MVLSDAEESKVNESSFSMQTNLTVTFSEKGNKYTMRLEGDSTSYKVDFIKQYGGREEGHLLTILVDDFYSWISNEPMLHNGGLYGLCFYANEARGLPKWVRKFANAFA